MKIKKIKKKLCMVLYHGIAYHLPSSHKKYCIFGKEIKFYLFKYIRQILVKNIIENMGKNVNIETNARINPNISIGENSGIGIKCEIQEKVYIGKNVMMGPETLIYTQNHETKRIDIPMIEQGMTSTKPVFIEDNVWIGRRVIILPGVTIGKGSILGAGTVVAKNIPPYSVVVGNPGKIVKQRK